MAEVRIELPDPPRPGCSKGVQRRVYESIPAVRVAFASIEILSEAIERRWDERIESHREEWQREAREAAGDGERRITVPDLVHGIGCEIQRLAARMVEEDEDLDVLRYYRRQGCERRDSARRALYGELGRFRKSARDYLRPRPAPLAPALRGETVREPGPLIQQAGECLSWAAAFAAGAGNGSGDSSNLPWQTMKPRLESLRDELEAGLAALDRTAPSLDMALDMRNRAMAAYDDRYLKGTRLLERLYYLLGMPSLAAAVRPHLKVTARVGRPAKSPVPDEHPDLVARVLVRVR